MPTQKAWEDFLKKRGLFPFALTELHWFVKDGNLNVPYIENKFIHSDVYERYRKTPDDKFKSHANTPAAPYFLHSDKEYGNILIIVEGEPDAATIYGCGYSFLASPGNTAWKPEWWELASGFDKVIVLLDYKGGDVFLANLVKHKPVDIPLYVSSAALLKTNAEDINDAHMKNNCDFAKTKEQLKKLIDTSREVKIVKDDEEIVEILSTILEKVSQPDIMDGDRKALCIFHEEVTPSLDFGTKGFTCFSCGKSGSIEKLGAMMGLVYQNDTNDKPKTRFITKNNRICEIKYDDEGIHYEPLCNFTSRIAKELTIDDGFNPVKKLYVSTTLYDGSLLEPIELTPKEFIAMMWPIEQSPRAIINPGTSVKDKLRTAIQEISNLQGIEKETIYTHIGWRKINDKWVYIHGNGAVNAKNISVKPAMQILKTNYVLPEESTTARPSLDLLNLADAKIMIPLIAGVYRAPLNVIKYPSMMLWLFGESGSMKSTMAALMLSHFGKGFTHTKLTDSWISTANFIEKGISIAKDTWYVIDDYAPEFNHSGDSSKIKAIRLIRGLGNGTYRNKLNSDSSMQVGSIPCALVVATAEQEPPEIESNIARTFLVEFTNNCINVTKLTYAQKHSDELAKAMRGYIEWLALQMDNLPEVIDNLYNKYTQEFVYSSHKRMSENAIHLLVGWVMFLNYALYCHDISKEEYDNLINTGIEALSSDIETQENTLEESNPIDYLFSIIKTGLTTGKYYLKDKNTGNIDHTFREDDFDKNAIIIGWILDDCTIGILPNVAWSLYVSEMNKANMPTWFNKRALCKRLKDSNRIHYDYQRQSYTTGIRINGIIAYLWVFDKEELINAK